jgi:23S rRNA (cytidine1920-2'-O)/16S rRNA (cytidine1409-2'-O)-methyltransferase
VTANGELVRKASEEIAADAALRASAAHPYVSRGGVKLAAALEHFGFDPKGKVCLDVGASTGGFTQVLLERGAMRVYAVDVGRGQLHESLRGRPEVATLEETDIRTLSPARFDEPPELVTVDVSFISLKLVLPAALALAKRPAQLIALIKPQFEAGRTALKKGVVRDPAVHAAVCDDIASFVVSLGWRVIGIIPSPIAGGDGNAEFLLGAERD